MKVYNEGKIISSRFVPSTERRGYMREEIKVTDINLPEDMPLISVIVPVYKAENYLFECLDSILKQTYQNLEIILIDDGSPDNCPAICDEYAMRDSRIVVIHQENSGVSSARNTGLDLAKGEYVGFVDADDYISKVMYECLYNEMARSGTDIVTCDCYWLALKLSIKKQYSAVEFSSQEAIFARLTFQKGCDMLMNVWNKLYRMSVIDGIRFDKKISFGEDGVFNAEVIVQAKNGLSHIDSVFYANRPHRGSLRQSGKYALDTRGIIEPFLTVYPEHSELIENFYELWSIKCMMTRNWMNILSGHMPNYRVTLYQIIRYYQSKFLSFQLI